MAATSAKPPKRTIWAIPAAGMLARAGNPIPSFKIEGSREGNSEFLNKHTDERRHGNTSVLDLHSTTTGEAINVINVSKGIEKVERTGVNSKTIGGTIVSVQGGVVSLGSGRSESSRRGNEGGEDSELHHFD